MPFTSARNSDCVFYEQGDGLPCGTSLHYYESIEASFPNKVFSVAHYLGLRAVALLMVSDIHPIKQEAPKWDWHMTEEMKYHLAEQGIAFAKQLTNNPHACKM